jgi:hypothetical protein
MPGDRRGLGLRGGPSAAEAKIVEERFQARLLLEPSRRPKTDPFPSLSRDYGPVRVRPLGRYQSERLQAGVEKHGAPRAPLVDEQHVPGLKGYCHRFLFFFAKRRLTPPISS